MGVGEMHRPRQRLHQPRRVDRLLRLAGKGPVERSAVDELEREVGEGVVLADLVDLDDVRMLERCHGLRFDEEPGQCIGAGVAPREHHLQGDEPVELLLPRLVDHPHPAAAELAEDFVAADMGHRPPGLRVDRGENRIGD